MPKNLLNTMPPVAADSVEMGARLRAVRERNGLSQRELAKRSNVTHSSISMIEQGQNSPSINSLEKILSGIPMTLAHFFMCDLGELDQIVYRSNELRVQESQQLGVIVHSIPSERSTENTHLQKIILTVGADTGPAPLLSSRRMAGFIVSGRLELTANLRIFSLDVNDVFNFTAQCPYRFRNLSAAEECVLLVCEV